MRAALLALAIALAAVLGAPAHAEPRPEPARLVASTEMSVDASVGAVEVRGVLPVRVAKTRSRGQLRVTNPNDHWVRFIWGTFSRAQPDGRKRIEAFQTITVRVHRHRVDWIALLDGYQLAGQGSVRGIRL